MADPNSQETAKEVCGFIGVGEYVTDCAELLRQGFRLAQANTLVCCVSSQGGECRHAIETLKARYPHLQVIFACQQREVDCLLWGLRVGVADFVSWPEERSHLFKLVEKSVQEPSFRRDAGDRMSDAQTFILQHYHENDLRVRTIASACNMSVSSFNRKFKNEFGISCKEYISNVRVEAAKHLLQTSNKSIVEISYVTGYCDASHMIKNFKRKVGKTPASYREICL